MSSNSVNLMMLNMSFGTLPPPFIEAKPTCGFILGSGWSQALSGEGLLARVGYDRIAGLGPGTVVGHAGELRLIRRHGITAVAFCGRRHWYEGEGWTPVVLPVELLRRLGVRDVLLTNAAGGIHPSLSPGNFLLIKDHINTVGINPLQGPVVPGWGTRFPDQSQVYHPLLRNLLQAAAQDASVSLAEGVYAFTAGPMYETPAEIRSYAAMGAHAVGMSTVPEAMVANAAGLRVAAVSCISNMAAGIQGPPLEHADVLSETRKVMPQMAGLLDAFLKRLAEAR
ncbi:MAG: purine-nucleoside phosphorylase [Kiritimatiellia bacterium]